MSKFDFSGKVINMIGDIKFFENTKQNVTLGNDINIYLKKSMKSVNLIKIVDGGDSKYFVKLFSNNPRKRILKLVDEFNLYSDNELSDFLKIYF